MIAKAPNDVCIVIPGIGGSVLERNGKTLWDVADRMFLRALVTKGRAFRDLTLTDRQNGDDTVVATRPVYGATIIPGFWNYGDYRPLSRRLEQLFGDRRNVMSFAYDWRMSNACTAARLKVFVDAILDSRPPGTRVVLVGHSMGGLVARRYLACENGYERCSLVITLGTPYRGAAKALNAIANGVPRIPGKTGARLHVLLRSLPSIHELLPTYACLTRGDDARTRLEENLPSSVASTGLYDAAMRFHITTERAIASIGAAMPPELAIAGQQQPTITLAELAGDEVRALPDSAWATPEGPVRGMGDGTVPRASAQPPEWGADSTRAHVVSGRHINLPADTSVHRAIGAALEGRQYLSLGAPEFGGISVAIPEVVSHDNPVVIEAHHPDNHLELEVWADRLDDGATLHHSILRRAGNGRYDRTIQGLSEGTYTVRVQGLADGSPQLVSEFVTVLPPSID